MHREARLLLSACIMLAGCSDAGPAGEYTLVRTARDTLPVVVEQTALCNRFLTSGRMKFEGEDRYSSVFLIEQRCRGTTLARAETLGVAHGRYIEVGDSLEFRNSANRPTGKGSWRTSDTLVVIGPAHTLILTKTK